MPGPRTVTAEFKSQLVLKVIGGEQSAAELCRQQQIKPQLLSDWKAAFLANAATVFQGDSRLHDAEQRIADRQTMELEAAHLPWRAVPGKKALSVFVIRNNTYHDEFDDKNSHSNLSVAPKHLLS